MQHDAPTSSRELIIVRTPNKYSVKHPIQLITHLVGIPSFNFLYQVVKSQSPERLQNIKVAFGTLFMYYITLVTYYIQVCKISSTHIE
jgi:hypothetical protein